MAAGAIPNYTYRLINVDDTELVYFNLQTTGFKPERDVVQILAKRSDGDDEDIFSRYVKPRKEIEPQATVESGLRYHMQTQQMYRYEQTVPSLDLGEAMEEFLKFLTHNVEGETPNVVLAVQGAKKYHCPVLVQAALLCRQLDRLRSIVVGFVDTDELFRAIFRPPQPIALQNEQERKSYKLKDLYREHCAVNEKLVGENRHYAAPVLMLEAVFRRAKSVFNDLLLESSFTIEYAVNRESWKVKVDGEPERVFEDFELKAAKSGLNYDQVKNTYEKEGDEAVKRLMHKKLNPTEVDKIIDHLATLNL